MQDRSIGRVVWHIEGSVPAANYLVLPRERDDSLGLTGRFLYLQVTLGRGWLGDRRGTHPFSRTLLRSQQLINPL